MIVAIGPMSPRDRLRHAFLTLVPWWNERDERRRVRKATAARLRAIRVRIAAENLDRELDRTVHALRGRT